VLPNEQVFGVVAGLPGADFGHVLADVVDVVAHVINAGVNGARYAVECLSRRRPLRGSTPAEREECGDSADHGRANN
jgi:hypothetical protein